MNEIYIAAGRLTKKRKSRRSAG